MGFRPHFKAHVSITTHPKMARIYADDQLLACWLRVGVEAVEKFAGKTGGSFILRDLALLPLANTHELADAIDIFRRIAAEGIWKFTRAGPKIHRIEWLKLPEKQGFGGETQRKPGENPEQTQRKPGANASDPTPTPTPILDKKKKKEKEKSATAPAAAVSVDPPDDWPNEKERDQIAAWAAKQTPKIERRYLGRALERFRDSSENRKQKRKNPRTRRGWSAAFRGGLSDEWLLPPEVRRERSRPVEARPGHGRIDRQNAEAQADIVQAHAKIHPEPVEGCVWCPQSSQG